MLGLHRECILSQNKTDVTCAKTNLARLDDPATVETVVSSSVRRTVQSRSVHASVCCHDDEYISPEVFFYVVAGENDPRNI